MVLGGPKSVNTLHRMHQYCVILPRLLTSDAAPLHPQKPYVMNSAYVVQVDSCNEKPHCNLCNKICLQILNKKSFVTHERQSLKAFCSNLEANAPFQIFSDTCSETDIFDLTMAGELSTSAAFSTSLLPSTTIQSRDRSTGRQPPSQFIHSSSADAPISRVPQQPTLLTIQYTTHAPRHSLGFDITQSHSCGRLHL